MGYISEKAKQDIINRYSSERYEHIQNVIDLAVKLAIKYSADVEKAYTAALLHDIAKDMEVNEMVALLESADIHIDEEYHTINILHGPCSAVIAYEDYDIDDEEILYPIYYHTFGRADMSKMEKIIFIADAAEKGRTYKNVGKIRKVMNSNLDQAVEMSLSGTIAHVIAKGEVLFPATAAALEYFKEQRIRR